MKCDLVRSVRGWYLQYELDGKPRATALSATTEADAISEAHTAGFDEFAIFDEITFETARHTKTVRVPKPPFP